MGVFNYWVVDYFVVKGNDVEIFVGGGFCGFNDQMCMGDFFMCWCIKVVQQFYLVGVDQ